jgi:hypothetical protein
VLRFVPTHRDARGTIPQVSGSPFDSLRPGQTPDSCRGSRGRGSNPAVPTKRSRSEGVSGSHSGPFPIFGSQTGSLDARQRHGGDTGPGRKRSLGESPSGVGLERAEDLAQLAMSMSLSGPASLWAREPNTFSSAIPDLSQMAARRFSSTSTPRDDHFDPRLAPDWQRVRD